MTGKGRRKAGRDTSRSATLLHQIYLPDHGKEQTSMTPCIMCKEKESCNDGGTPQNVWVMRILKLLRLQASAIPGRIPRSRRRDLFMSASTAPVEQYGGTNGRRETRRKASNNLYKTEVGQVLLVCSRGFYNVDIVCSSNYL